MKSIETQAKCIGRYRWRLLTVAVALLFLSPCIKSQVTIGDGIPPQDFSMLEIVSNEKGGLRLPHLTTDQRITLTNSAAFQAQVVDKGKGLTIYNVDTNCVEYWNSNKWISLCSGSSSFIGGDCAKDMIPHGGGTVSCAITDPDCNSLGKYVFTIINGSDYATLVVTDAGAGKFDLILDPNDWASDRQALVMVTSPCGQDGIFVFNQQGDASDCSTVTVPEIRSVGDASICVGGAAYLYLDGYPTDNNFIWTLNGVQVGTGHNYVATTSGKYIVYRSRIGCPNSKSAQVTLKSTPAPAPVRILSVGNNGEACGSGGKVTLIASTPSSGDIIWFRDGELIPSETGKTQIDAGKGYWYAVVKGDECISIPSAGVTVTENTSGTEIPIEPKMKINGSAIESDWKFCEGGSLFLEVDGVIEPIYTYTWYANNTQIGVGSGIYYPLPSFGEVAIRLRISGTGCAKEVITVKTISVDKAPNAPFIESNTKGYLCGGKTTLTAVPSGYTTYRWFKDGVVITETGKNTASIEVDKTGDYTVSAIDGTCVSTVSWVQQVRASDFGTLTWISHPADVNVGETKTYSVSMDFPEGAVYNWTIPSAYAEITNGKGTSSITVRFNKATDPNGPQLNVVCTASNTCGTTNTLTQPITIGSGCEKASIKSTSNQTPTVKQEESVVLSVTAGGTPPFSYQWYKENIAINGATNASYTYKATDAVNTYQFRCDVQSKTTCNEIASATFNVTVSPNPANLPSGTGIFSGKTCFDIAFSNDNINSCAPLTSRTGQKTTFSNRTEQDPASGNTAPYTGVQVYTFTPSGAVSNVRFDYVDVTGKVIKKLTSRGNKVVVEYKESLDGDLKGITRQNALKADLYAIYTPISGEQEHAVKLTATFQDCACCGAKASDGRWLEFMCHNLGANEDLDPFSYVVGNTDGTGGTLGYLFQWGRKDDGHEKRASGTTTTLATSNIPGHGYFILSSGSPYDWRLGGGNTSRWGDGTQNVNMAKAANDPCPPGWKVPSQKQWSSIFRGGTTSGAPGTATANTWTWTTSGYKVGDALFLPAAGIRTRSYGSLTDVGTNGYYWSSTVSGTNSYILSFKSGNINPAIGSYHASGFSVRCVAE